MAKLIVKRLPASTLLEVIISMVIIMAVFTIAIGIYTKVTQSGLSFSKTAASMQMKKILDESVKNADWEDAVLIKDSIEYKKTVTGYAGYTDLLLISVEANQQGRKLGALTQVLKKQEDEDNR